MNYKDNFKDRFEVYYPMLCRIAFGYIPDSDVCEDIVQECFIAVWNNGKYQLEEREFVSYMVRAVKNNCISSLRKQNNLMVAIEDLSLQGELAELAEEEDDTATNDERVERVLAVLPPKCKEIFLLSKLHGMKYQEIAQRLNLSVKTVENQMGKALKLIREQVKVGGFYLWFLFLFLFMHLKY